jgi:sugar/nucleoside kinase (ribokinase family)
MLKTQPVVLKRCPSPLACRLRIPRLSAQVKADDGRARQVNASGAPNVPSPFPKRTDRSLLKAFVTARSRFPSRSRSTAAKLLGMGPRNVTITLGHKGLFFKNRHEEISMKAHKMNVVDTTAAGDAFMGALACGLSEGKPIREVLKFANGAGALATTKLGAQPSLPLRRSLNRFLSKAAL